MDELLYWGERILDFIEFELGDGFIFATSTIPGWEGVPIIAVVLGAGVATGVLVKVLIALIK